MIIDMCAYCERPYDIHAGVFVCRLPHTVNADHVAVCSRVCLDAHLLIEHRVELVKKRTAKAKP